MGHFLKKKCVDSKVNVHILASTSVPFTLTTVQVPNLALTHMKRITVLLLDFLQHDTTGAFRYLFPKRSALSNVYVKSNLGLLI